MKFLIRIFGQKQLAKVFEAAKFDDNEAVVIVLEGNNAKKIKDNLQSIGFVEDKGKNVKFGGNKKDLMDFYGIGQSELDTLLDLDDALEQQVIEKISFVALER